MLGAPEYEAFTSVQTSASHTSTVAGVDAVFTLHKAKSACQDFKELQAQTKPGTGNHLRPDGQWPQASVTPVEAWSRARAVV